MQKVVGSSPISRFGSTCKWGPFWSLTRGSAAPLDTEGDARRLAKRYLAPLRVAAVKQAGPRRRRS